MNEISLINCEEALRRLFDYLDRELDETRCREMEQHLKISRACYSRAEFEKRLKERLPALGSEQAPASFRRRIRQLVADF